MNENKLKLQMRKSVESEIRKTIGTFESESGGYLFGNRIDYIVEKVVFDDSNRTSVTWTFNPSFINPIIKKLWEEEGLELIGFVHSHPNGNTAPSSPDVVVFEKYLNRFDCDRLIVPIIQSSYGNCEYEFHPYIKLRGDNEKPFRKVKLEILDDLKQSNKQKSDVVIQNVCSLDSSEKSVIDSPSDIISQGLTDFSRIIEAVDVAKMKKTTALILGAGGAFTYYDSLTRTGIGHIIACDFDTVDASNLVRQGYFVKDINKFKVHALGEHLREVNPELNFTAITDDITTYPEEKLEELISSVDIILFLTDSFKAQAFGNLISQKYQKPAIWGGYYYKSRCAELVFYIPDVTPGCFRCAVSSRYEAQSQKTVKISSSSNTIFHSQLLDAYLGMLTLAILHNNTQGYEYSNWFGDFWEHNLIQIKVNPMYKGLFEKKYGDDKRLYCFGAIWQKIEREIEPAYRNCPDCVGIESLKIMSNS